MKKNSIIRLARYRNALKKLKTLGFKRFFSSTIGEAIGVKATQVRKDFSEFNIEGKKKAGYDVEEVLEYLDEIFGKNIRQKLIVVGAGRIGTALVDYKGFQNEMIEIAACFDIDPVKTDKNANPPVLLMDELPAFLETTPVDIAVLCVPDVAARHALDKLAEAGVKGVLNLAPISLTGTESLEVININLASEIESLFYFVNNKGKS